MQPSIEKKAGTVGRISAFVDNLLGRAGVYAVLSFLAIRPFLLRNADEQLASLLGCAVFPLFFGKKSKNKGSMSAIKKKIKNVSREIKW